jgi:hypothetical protein
MTDEREKKYFFCENFSNCYQLKSKHSHEMCNRIIMSIPFTFFLFVYLHVTLFIDEIN